MTQCYYRWHKGNSRYYQISIYKDMFDDLILTCVWGGLHSRLGNYKHILISSIDEGLHYIENVMYRRKKRGYVLIFSSGAPKNAAR